MTFVHSRQWLKFTSVGVESDSIPPAAGVHTAGGGWPIFEARALANMAARKGEQAGASSPKSDELTPDIFTGEVQPVAPVKAPAPIRTDTAVAAEADELLDGIRAAVEVQRLAKQKANAVNQYSEPSDNLLSEPKDEHETKAATKAAELFNTNRRSKGSTVNPHRQAAQPARQELHTPSR